MGEQDDGADEPPEEAVGFVEEVGVQAEVGVVEKGGKAVDLGDDG